MRATGLSVSRNITNRIRLAVTFLLCVFTAVFFLLSFDSHAEEPDKTEKTVRVGWYETPFNTLDQYGRRSGYAYEYQRKIAAYTGWKYEYVEGSWLELLQMLIDGEIDLMSDISYTEERSSKILYSSYPMGTESYYIYIEPNNSDISADDLSTLSGKRIGVTSNSIQEKLFYDWAGSHGIEAELIGMSGSEEDSISKLSAGELDAFITLDAYGDPDVMIPICKIGSSDFFFAVSKSRPDLLSELNYALNRIQDENKYYNMELNEKFLHTAIASKYLSTKEKLWLADHGTIRVGYQDNYLAFCAKDSKTGELNGALKDYLNYASEHMVNARLEFEAVCYPTASAAMEAMKNGEVDCMFPANLTAYDGETLGVVMTQPLMTSEMMAVVRESEQQSFLRKEEISVAVNEGNPNYDMFLADHFPTWKIIYYKDTPACLEGIAAGEADCILISNYRFSNISKQCEDLKLVTVSTGVNMDYNVAVREGNTVLYSILTKVTDLVPVSTVNSALTYYSTEDAKTSFFDYLKSHMVLVLGIISLILLVIVILLWRSIRAEKKAAEEQRQLDEMNRLVNYDSLTSVRNKGAFTNYIKGIQERIDKDDAPEFAVAILDCNNLKQINDQYGHEKGDEYLKASCRIICHTFRHSAVFRIGGDEFAVVMMNDDYNHRDELVKQFEAAQKESEAAENKWDQVHVALGIAPYDAKTDRRSANITIRRADKIMYENKRLWKESQGKLR